MAPKLINGLSEVFAAYDGVILDLWGVVHDGIAPFPDTLRVLQLLKKAERKVWLLSNAPRRSYTVVEKLTAMGITPELYDGIMTSGEMSRQALHDTLLAKWGKRCFHIGRANDLSVYEGLDVEMVEDPAQADFVLNCGVEDFSDPAEKYKPILQTCILYKLPMLCANPDRVVHIEDKLVICAGTLADMYAEMDGAVTYFGKPHRSVYSQILAAMESRRVLAVGDSMRTDIEGAAGAGLDSVLVLSGIHREEIAGDGLDGFLSCYPFQPNYVMKPFLW
jgi:HAD superfamily hydrolase (TIGR01459 family)